MAAKRPSSLTPDLASEICRRLADGENLRAICKDEGMPNERTVRRWALEDATFGPQYARAREIGYQGMFDEIQEIADNASADPAAVNRDRLWIDTRKWMLAKALPKVYGDRLDLTNRHQLIDENDKPYDKIELAAALRSCSARACTKPTKATAAGQLPRSPGPSRNRPSNTRVGGSSPRRSSCSAAF